MRALDQWLLWVFSLGFTGNAVRDYVGRHWWWAIADTLLAVLCWWALARLRRRLYGSLWGPGRA
ncbi:MAG TPA: hypothetical protein VE441_08300 [Mycobacterium sp.]|nr:hypothetical protein [Mycobacterium sp.]